MLTITDKMVDAASQAGAMKDSDGDWMDLRPACARAAIEAAIKADPQAIINIAQSYLVPKGYTEEQFNVAAGRYPIEDELERVNCAKAGHAGHYLCGWCDKHDKPRLICGCSLATSPTRR